jgi:hypothetical protein
MLRDLKSSKLMYLKAALFFITGVLSALLILSRQPTFEITLLLLITIWSFCRLYYFVFYVIEKYVDPTYRFSGLGSFIAHLITKGRKQ